MKPDDILLLGIKHRVCALDRATGKRLWQTELGGGLGGSFVSLLADDHRVFVHHYGELLALDLFTGRILWRDPLSGLGYDLASLAFPGGTPLPASQIRHLQDQAAADAAASTSNPAT